MAANSEWETFRLRDAEILQKFKEIAKAFNPDATLHVRIAEGHNLAIDTSLSAADSDPRIQALLAPNEPVAHVLQLNVDAQTHVILTRLKDRSLDTVRLQFVSNWDPVQLLRLLPLAREQFPHVNRAESIDRILGPEIAQFYQARDAALMKLEDVAQSLISQTDKYRLSLQQQADAKEEQRDASHAKRREELETEYRQKQSEVAVRQKELDDFKASLDDRQSRHARRALREHLQKVLEGHGKQFSLTAGTTKKRRNVHALFLVMLALAVGYVAATIAEGWGQAYDWARALRLALGVAGAIGVLLLYIRWTDQWFRQHADEEFRLKRMGLDVDRASWVVETAMEWQHENHEPIPVQLLDQLSRGLFSRQDTVQRVRHPIEELASAVLSGASNLRLDIPGVGEVTLGPRGAKRVAKKLEEHQGAD
jgi:hypothetical protein